MNKVPIYLEYFKNWRDNFEQPLTIISTKYAKELNNDADLVREDIKGFIDVILQIQGEELKRYYCECNEIPDIDDIDNLHKFLCEELQVYMMPAYSACGCLDLDKNTVTKVRTEIEQYLNDAVYGFVKNEKKHTVISVSGRGKRLTESFYPIDKINSSIWKPLKDIEDLKDITEFKLHFERHNERKKDPIILPVQLSFEEITEEILKDNGVVKQLNMFDKRVYIAIANCFYKLGLRRITIGQIYHAMGNDCNVCKSDYERIYNSLFKMAHTLVKFDNEEEAEKYNYKHVEIDTHLLQCTIYTEYEKETSHDNNSVVDLYVNGKKANVYIDIDAEPVLFQYARDRTQYITVEQTMLNVPGVRNTQDSIILKDYLMKRVKQAINGTGQKKILKETIYKEVRANTSIKRMDTDSRTQLILSYWKEKGFCKGYTTKDEFITIKI